MTQDISTVVWKEWRELLRQRGNWRGFLLGLLVPIGIFGVLFPLQVGERWVHSPISISAWLYMPVALVMTMMADSFAGERERHTLETLLASRLPDQAILYGKILAAISYSIFLALSILAIGLITVNVVYAKGELLLYAAPIFWGGALGGLLISVLGAAIGVLISLRAATVRQAAQTLSYVMLGVFFVPLLLFELLPRRLWSALGALLAPFFANGRALVIGVITVLVLADVLLLLVARVRFRRHRLMLD